ncbi:hypothetical protein GX48_08306 [Paracoccidioides brasiliensis]|nr:hypothetical protein GX48_08306 [Paracoccidioides brasiliensis]
MVEKYHTVLVVGREGEKCRIVAEGYGFKDVVTPDPQSTSPTTDIVWSTSREHTRIGMGALRASFRALFQSSNGQGTQDNCIWQASARDIPVYHTAPPTWHRLGTGYCLLRGRYVTPESDIRGTNAYSQSNKCENGWYSILVKTGAYTKMELFPRFPAGLLWPTDLLLLPTQR